MKSPSAVMARVLALTLLAAGCGGDHDRDRDMMGPRQWGGAPGPALVSVTPSGGATQVPASAPIVIQFGAAMAAGMERYVDLHSGDLAGPVVPMDCRWTADRTALTCTPRGPLGGAAGYVVHLGGGMMAQSGQPLDCGRYGPGMGGRWVTPGGPGPTHGGGPWGAMPPAWRSDDGTYGMAFSFTTA